MVTYWGRKALDAVIASKNAVPAPYWFGGSIPHVRNQTGPVLTPGSYKLYEELQKKVLERGILTQKDIDRIARAEEGGSAWGAGRASRAIRGIIPWQTLVHGRSRIRRGSPARWKYAGTRGL